MKSRPDNVKAIPAPVPGNCDICGEPKILIAQCHVTQLRAGRCCALDLRYADEMLSFHGPKAGIIHPQPAY